MNATNDAGRGPGLWRVAAWGAVAALLIAPLVAMQFTTEVNWTTSDFAIAGALLIGAGLLIELVVWKARSRALRIGACVAVVAAVLVIWAQGAVGIF
jgi:ABC-type cobalamin transport system permease subunit